MLKNKNDSRIIKSDHSFNIYGGGNVYLDGEFKEGSLILVSNVFGEEDDSEKTYRLSKEETKRLFEKISFEEFVELCRAKRLEGLEKYLHDNGIQYDSFTF